jgi:hypothetical protein
VLGGGHRRILSAQPGNHHKRNDGAEHEPYHSEQRAHQADDPAITPPRAL